LVVALICEHLLKVGVGFVKITNVVFVIVEKAADGIVVDVAMRLAVLAANPVSEPPCLHLLAWCMEDDLVPWRACMLLARA
jgi:hypothetical protein